MSTRNLNSLFNKTSRYVAGGKTETANGRIEWWERTIFDSDQSDISYAVSNTLVGRLDLISAAFYDDPRYWWVIAQYNNIIDPVAEVKAGRVLQIPSKSRLPLMLNNRLGGSPSTKQPVATISPIVT